MRKRILNILVVILLGLAMAGGGVEVYARHKHLDVMGQRPTILRPTPAGLSRPAPDGWGVAYLPRDFEMLEGGGFKSSWGVCRPDFAGRTVLAFGDSTTRQSGGVGLQPRTSVEEAQKTWPAFLNLGSDVQVCVIAEDGYHPRDIELILKKVLPTLKVDLLVGMLCFNDGYEFAPQLALDVTKGTALFNLPLKMAVYPPWDIPWLWDHSEAFRYLHWYMANESGLKKMRKSQYSGVPTSESLIAIASFDVPLVLWYLPHLSFQADQDQRTLQSVAEAELPINQLVLDGNPIDLRYQFDDPIHLSERGHRQVAAQIAKEVTSILEFLP